MIYRFFIGFLLWGAAFSYPQSIMIPEIRNSAPPLEVNSLTEHKQFTRSIGANPTPYNKIEETIKEVEAMLKINPTLPRLTRGEIMDLIENITKEDMVKGTQKTTPIKEQSFNDISQSVHKFRTTSTQISIMSTTTSAPAPENVKVHAKQRRRRPQLATSTTEQHTSSTEVPVTTHRPKTRGRRPGKRRPTTTEKHPNHRYPDEEITESPKTVTSLPSHGIKIVEAPKYDPIVDDLIMQENQQKDVVMKQELEESTRKSSENKVSPTVVRPVEKSTTKTPLKDESVPDTKEPEKKPYKSVVSSKVSPMKEDEEIKKMLASLGVFPVQTTTTTTAVPDISNVADNLSPEMRDLLMNFGLMTGTGIVPGQRNNPSIYEVSTTSAPDSFNPVKAEVKPESYTSFKPLPNDDNSRHEMEELLARFGLGSIRTRKSLPKKKEQDMNFDVVPDQYKGVLEDIGLMDRQGKMIRAEALVKTEEKQHVFNPVDSQYASDEEIGKLNKLLEFVKRLEQLNRTVTDEDVQKMDVENLKELLAGLNKEQIVPLDEQTAPNPINFDHGLDKNEVKRQKNSTTPSNPKEEVENITLNVNTKVESATPNIKDLEASFGGQVDANPVTEPPVPDTTTKRTGFYYLLDWNTFLDIDDQKGKRVNLRFQPTAGDPKRFLSVSVP